MSGGRSKSPGVGRDFTGQGNMDTTDLCTFVLRESIDDAFDDASLDCFARLSVTCWSPDDLRLARGNGVSTSLRPAGFSWLSRSRTPIAMDPSITIYVH